MVRKKLDKNHYNGFLYCRINEDYKKNLTIMALNRDKKLYEFLNDLFKETIDKDSDIE